MKRHLSKLMAFLLIFAMLLPLAACGKNNEKAPETKGGTESKESENKEAKVDPDNEVAKVIEEAEKMSNEELFKKAAEELDGKTMNGIGNSSRGKTAAEGFIAELAKLKEGFSGKIEWSQPKNNSIFEALTADINANTQTYSMTLIQDGNQIQSKMVDTGLLLNYIPKDFAEAQGVDVNANGKPFLTLQTLIKVFMVNNQGNTKITNFWDFVAKDSAPLFMGVNSEPIGKNFLYMLTSEKYSNLVKEAFDALPEDQKTYFNPTIEEMKKEAEELGLEAENAAYGLAWVKLWCNQYNEVTDDGPICNELVTKSAAGETGLLVYSKLRSIEESAESSVNNVDVAAYLDGYKGIGGYGYKHYLMIPKTSPLPWTACAFISYMTTSQEGFAAWGKDIGGYSANPACNQDHSKDGEENGQVKFPAKNDRGYDWWMKEGNIVLEDPIYCSKVALDLGDVIDGWIKH